MNYRRVLLLTDLEASAADAVRVVRRVVPAAELLLVVARLGATRLGWLSAGAPADLNAAATAALDALVDAASGAAQTIRVRVEPEAKAEDLAELAGTAKIDLIATPSLREIAQLRRLTSVAVLWISAGCAIDHPISSLFCIAVGDRARRSVAEFLRDHATPAMRAHVLTSWKGDPAAALDVAGVSAHVTLVKRPPGEPADLIVLPRFPGALLATRRWPAPTLILPALRARLRTVRAMDVADLVDDNGVVRLAAHYALGVGRNDPIPDQALAIVSGGRVVAEVTTHDGMAELPPGLMGETFGLYRVTAAGDSDPLMAIEQDAAVSRPASVPLVLFDADLGQSDLRLLADLAGFDLLAVRMRPMKSCDAIRGRLQRAGLTPRVIDARAVLDEGAALDVPEAADPVRLARVAARMRGAGFPVVAIVHDGPHAPATIGFASMRAPKIKSNAPSFRPPASAAPSLARRLETTTGAALIGGSRIEVELDNAKARRWLLEAIATAQRRVHLQVYMGLDDDVGSLVEAALAAAGARGVTVRVVVDSLHGLHGSFGLHNPLFDRLAGRQGVELRTLSPIDRPPSLEDLKQRDHRKLLVVDGAVALVGGRNLSHEYYTAFDEVRLSSRSRWREVPWLDGGARVEGPAVAALERSFLVAWTAAGGAPFDVSDRPAAGSSAARVVVHHGLRDACTLDAYVAMIDDAASHIYTVNGFPLILEIQHALLRALRRGVWVRTLFGNLTPKHNGIPFTGPFASARLEATELVHSRMDDLVAAGAEAYQLTIREQASWEPGLGAIEPHVHAKVISVDGRICSVGSANLDVTAGYWESELVLIVEDPDVASSLESRVDALMGASRRVDRADPEWPETARRRNWMRHWPGVLSV